jgi:hypothetical protein
MPVDSATIPPNPHAEARNRHRKLLLLGIEELPVSRRTNFPDRHLSGSKRVLCATSEELVFSTPDFNISGINHSTRH